MIMKKFLLSCLLLLFVSINPGAREKDVTVVDKLVPSNVRLVNSVSSGAEFSDLEKTVNTFLKNWSVAGASVAIAKDGRLVYARGFGYADTTTKEETQPFNKFRIASVSKLVTAVAIMKLNEEGKLSLSDKVFGPDGILNDPYFDNPKDKRVYSITVEHLLSHEGGWTQRYGDQMFMPTVIAHSMGVKAPVDTKTIVRYALNKSLHYTPGKGRSYSNLGYAILGLIVEKVSGMSYQDYCTKEILQPIGVYDMAIAGNLKSDKAPMEVTYYEPSDAHLKPSIYESDVMCFPSYGGNDIESLGGAGGWIATAPDLIRLMLSVDGSDTRPDILGGESIRLMTENENGSAPIGWKAILNDGTWMRTGSFPGTAAVMKKQVDGFTWVVLLNSSTWNGPSIYSYVNHMMDKIFNQVRVWPEYDLFNYSLPVPLKTTLESLPSAS